MFSAPAAEERWSRHGVVRHWKLLKFYHVSYKFVFMPLSNAAASLPSPTQQRWPIPVSLRSADTPYLMWRYATFQRALNHALQYFAAELPLPARYFRRQPFIGFGVKDIKNFTPVGEALTDGITFLPSHHKCLRQCATPDIAFYSSSPDVAPHAILSPVILLTEG